MKVLVRKIVRAGIKMRDRNRFLTRNFALIAESRVDNRTE